MGTVGAWPQNMLAVMSGGMPGPWAPWGGGMLAFNKSSSLMVFCLTPDAQHTATQARDSSLWCLHKQVHALQTSTFS